MGKRKIQGVGDVVKSVTDFIGIVPCAKCLERQNRWNTMFPNRLKPREMTDDELFTWYEFQDVRTLRLSNTQRKMVCQIYSDVFRVPYYEPCPSCDASPYLKMIERMDLIVKTYEDS